MINSQNLPDLDNIDYEYRMKRTGRTIDDLKFEYEMGHTQNTTYFNAILVVIGLTIAITPLMISNMGPFSFAFSSSIICLFSTSLGCFIGVAYCIYNVFWKYKRIDCLQEKYALYSESDISDEKRKFNYFRFMYISNLQMVYEAGCTSIIFCLCIFLFGVGFTLLVIDSVYTLNPFITIFFMFVPFVVISHHLWSKLINKSYTILFNNVKIYFDAVSNIFYEEEFNNYGDVIKFMVLITQKRQLSEESIEIAMKRMNSIHEQNSNNTEK